MVFLKMFFEKVNLKKKEKKNPQTTKKHVKLPSMQRVNAFPNNGVKFRFILKKKKKKKKNKKSAIYV